WFGFRVRLTALALIPRRHRARLGVRGRQTAYAAIARRHRARFGPRGRPIALHAVLPCLRTTSNSRCRPGRFASLSDLRKRGLRRTFTSGKFEIVPVSSVARLVGFALLELEARRIDSPPEPG